MKTRKFDGLLDKTKAYLKLKPADPMAIKLHAQLKQQAERLHRAARDEEISQLLESARNADREQRYSDVIKIFEEIPIGQSTSEAQMLLANARHRVSEYKDKNSPGDAAVTKPGRRVSKYKDKNAPGLRKKVKWWEGIVKWWEGIDVEDRMVFLLMAGIISVPVAYFGWGWAIALVVWGVATVAIYLAGLLARNPEIIWEALAAFMFIGISWLVTVSIWQLFLWLFY